MREMAAGARVAVALVIFLLVATGCVYPDRSANARPEGNRMATVYAGFGMKDKSNRGPAPNLPPTITPTPTRTPAPTATVTPVPTVTPTPTATPIPTPTPRIFVIPTPTIMVPPTPTVTPVPVYPLALDSWRCYRDAFIGVEHTMGVTGTVKNVSTGRLQGVEAITRFYAGSGLTIAKEAVRVVPGTLLPGESGSFSISVPLDTALNSCDLDFAGETGSPILTLDASSSPSVPTPVTRVAEPTFNPVPLWDFVEDGERVFLFSKDADSVPFKLGAGEWRLEWTFLRRWNASTRIALVNPGTNELLLVVTDVWQDAAFDLTFKQPTSLILYVDVAVESPWRVTIGGR